MRSILEKAIVHLLNGEQEKAEGLFHKFMVGKARAIHESLRQDEDIELGEGWDNEIKEEEYFDDSELEAPEDSEPSDIESDVGDDVSDVEGEGDEVVGDELGDDEFADDELGDVDSEVDDLGNEEEGIEGKLDDLESKIDELTAEFDRLMSHLDGEGEGLEGEEGEFGDEDLEGEGLEGLEDTGDEVDGEEPEMDADDSADLGNRLETDGAEVGEQPEDETMEGVESDDDMLDEQLNDITESVLSELDKVTMPGNSEGKEVGSGGKTISVKSSDSLPHHNVNDRMGAKPYLVRGGNNDSFERETPPPKKGVETLVKGVRKGNARNSFKDTMTTVPKDGDSSALLNSNHAGAEKKSEAGPVSGKIKPRVK